MIVASASAIDWYICLASRLSRSFTETRESAAEECCVATQPPSAPQASESRTRPASSARSLAGVCSRTRRDRRAAGARCAGRARCARAGRRGERGGHEPISAICCFPSVTRAGGSGWKPTASTYFGWLPVVMTHRRKALSALALAASGWRVLTTAYS